MAFQCPKFNFKTEVTGNSGLVVLAGTQSFSRERCSHPVTKRGWASFIKAKGRSHSPWTVAPTSLLSFLLTGDDRQQGRMGEE